MTRSAPRHTPHCRVIRYNRRRQPKQGCVRQCSLKNENSQVFLNLKKFKKRKTYLVLETTLSVRVSEQLLNGTSAHYRLFSAMKIWLTTALKIDYN